MCATVLYEDCRELVVEASVKYYRLSHMADRTR